MKKKYLILIFFFAVAIPVMMNNWGLTESSEARYAEISKEMYLTHDFINPKLLGIAHFHKPPVTYYITALGYLVAGINEFGSRIFLAVALLFQILLVYLIADLLYKNHKVAVLSTLVYFSFPIVQVAAKNLTTDCYLATFIFAAIYFFLQYRTGSRKSINIYGFYIFCALAFLTKGPVGILPPAFFAIAFARITKNKISFSIHQLLGLLMGLLISASWFVVLIYRNPQILQYFVGHQLVDRVSTNSFSRAKPFWYYFAFIPLVGMPLIVILADFFRIKKYRLSFTVQQKILLTSFFLCFLIFTLSASKLILYVLPLYLFLALLIAEKLMAMPDSKQRVYLNITCLFFTIIFLGIIAVIFLHTAFVFSPIPLLVIGFTGVIFVWLFNTGNKLHTPYRLAGTAAGGMFLLTVFMPVFMLANELQVNSIKPIVQKMNSIKPGNDGNIIVYNYLLPSLEFYIGQRPVTISNGSNISIRELQFENDTNRIHKHYLEVRSENDDIKKLAMQKMNYVIALKKDPIPDSLKFLVKNLPDTLTTGKWILYY